MLEIPRPLLRQQRLPQPVLDPSRAAVGRQLLPPFSSAAARASRSVWRGPAVITPSPPACWHGAGTKRIAPGFTGLCHLGWCLACGLRRLRWLSLRSVSLLAAELNRSVTFGIYSESHSGMTTRVRAVATARRTAALVSPYARQRAIARLLSGGPTHKATHRPDQLDGERDSVEGRGSVRVTASGVLP